jgi:BirA family biotin operon repressor/biotin-[acetyl-CoA-carboxylase] ligase
VSPEGFLDHVAAAFDTHERQFATYGFDPIRAAWLAHAARLGEVIIARMPNEEITGTFRDVDGGGNLVLETPGGTRRIAAAEIFF